MSTEDTRMSCWQQQDSWRVKGRGGGGTWSSGCEEQRRQIKYGRWGGLAATFSAVALRRLSLFWAFKRRLDELLSWQQHVARPVCAAPGRRRGNRDPHACFFLPMFDRRKRHFLSARLKLCIQLCIEGWFWLLVWLHVIHLGSVISQSNNAKPRRQEGRRRRRAVMMSSAGARVETLAFI